MSTSMPPPTFLIIGAQKSATRWLRTNLGLHPEIYTAPDEVSFFNNEFVYRNKGMEHYRRGFPGWSGERIVGESTPGYMIWRHQPDLVAARIKHMLPDVRLIAILRNPVDRAKSAFVHQQKRRRLPKDADLLDLVRQHDPRRHRMGFVAGGWYAASLKPYRRLFGDQLLVLLHDDLKTDARSVYDASLRHVGAPVGFVPPDLAQVRFSNQTKKRSSSSMPPETREALYQYFRQDIAELEELFGLDLSGWRVGSDRPGEPDQRVAIESLR